MKPSKGSMLLAAVGALAMFADARSSHGQSSSMSGSGGMGMPSGSGGGTSGPDVCPTPGAGLPPHHEAMVLSPRRNLRFGVGVMGVDLVYDSGNASHATAHGGPGWRIGRATLTTLTSGAVELDEAGAKAVFTPQTGGFDAPSFETRRLELVSSGVYDLHLGGGTVARFQNGRESEIRDPHGVRVTFSYDGSGRLTSMLDVATGVATSLSYAGGRLASVSREGVTQTLTYDGAGRLASVGTPSNASGTQPAVYSFDYDPASDRITAITNEAGETTQVGYAIDGGLASVSLPDTLSYELRCETDPNDGLLVLRVVDSFGQSFSQKHAADGAVVSTTDSFGRVTTYTRDTAQRIVSTSSDGLTASVTYNDADDVTSSTGPDGKTTTFTYDDNHGLLSQTDPLGRTTSYTRDAFGNVTGITDIYGKTTYIDRNSQGDAWRVRTPDGLATTYTLDTWGRVTAVQEPGGTTTSWTLDARGAVSSVALPDGTSYAVTRASDGLPLSVTDRLGRVTSLTWDATRRLTHVDLPGSSSPYVHLQRDAAGRVTHSVAALGPTSQVVDRTYGLYGETATLSLNGIASQVAPRTHAMLPPPSSSMTQQGMESMP